MLTVWGAINAGRKARSLRLWLGKSSSGANVSGDGVSDEMLR